jgi:hypothetical protein
MQGWEPLCLFPGVNEPSIPFPQSNTREEFIRRFTGVKDKINI